LVFDISRPFHDPYNQDMPRLGPSTTHQLGASPHSAHVGNLREKSNLTTLISLNTFSNT